MFYVKQIIDTHKSFHAVPQYTVSKFGINIFWKQYHMVASIRYSITFVWNVYTLFSRTAATSAVE